MKNEQGDRAQRAVGCAERPFEPRSSAGAWTSESTRHFDRVHRIIRSVACWLSFALCGLAAATPAAAAIAYVQGNYAAPQSSVSATYTVAFKIATGGSGGGQPPTTPANPSAGTASNSAISLNWSASTDPAGVSGYLIEECQGTACTNFTQVATVTGTSFDITGLAAGTTYTFRIRAWMRQETSAGIPLLSLP